MMTESPHISVLVPCYNEEAIIEATAARLLADIPHCSERFEIVFCNDGSTDDTWRKLQILAQQHETIIAVGYQQNRGAGYAFREALKNARGEYLIHMDADLAMNPLEVCTMVCEQLQSNDIAIGSRYKGTKADYPLRRRIPSHVYSALFRLLFKLPLRDAMSGFFGFRRQILLDIPPLTMDGFEVYLELFAKAHAMGYKLVEVPIKFSHQIDSGEVSVLTHAPRQLINTLKIWKHSRFDWKL
jgi:glycosyltransferase involved in cell wall biosynthesis